VFRVQTGEQTEIVPVPGFPPVSKAHPGVMQLGSLWPGKAGSFLGRNSSVGPASESACRRGGCTGGFCVERFHKIQDHVSDALITGRRIDHGVVSGAVWPVDTEIFLDEFDAVVIDGIDALLRFLLGFAARYEAAHFIFPGTVKKDAERVRTIPEKVLRAPSHDHAVTGFRGVLNNTFGNLQNAFAVDDVELVRIETSFVTPAQKGLEEPVVERVGTFLAGLDDSFGTIGEPGDLFRQVLIPQLPAQLLGKQLSDFTAAAAVFPFNRKYSDHLGPLSPHTAKYDPTANEFISLIPPTLCRHRQDHSSSEEKRGRT